MADKADQTPVALDTLTDDEQKVLAKAIKKVEAEIFHNIIKRLSAWIAVVLGIFLIGGLINLSSCYSNVESSAVQKLANDPEVRDKVISKAQDNIAGMQEKLKKVNEQTAEIERANARAGATFVNDLEQIRFMIERLNNELSRRLPPDKPQVTRGGGKNK